VFEWNGRAYHDVTVAVNPRRGLITARTRRLGTYVIAEPVSGTGNR